MKWVKEQSIKDVDGWVDRMDRLRFDYVYG